MARNPDYATPEEALKKLCPFKATSDIDEVSGQCISHECMAWRWHESKVLISGNGLTGLSFYEKETSTTHGRCGMVPL